MPLTDQTIAEMRAGAEALARHCGVTGVLPPDYLESVMNTQCRMNALRAWETEGVIRIERRTRHLALSEKNITWTVIHLGRFEFEDRDAELKGCFPSELLVANIAMAIAAGQADTENGNLPPY